MTGRFNSILGIDILPEAIETYKFNHRFADGSEPAAICGDMREVTPADILKAVKKFGIKKAGDLDCLVGGPPCEGFSQNRTLLNGGRSHKFIDDERNWLFRWFVALAAALQPKIVLIENVPDLIRHRDGETRAEVFAALEDAGYVAVAKILHAADYGVPQMRRRAFFIAQRKSDAQAIGLSPRFPRATHRTYPLMHPTLADESEWLPGDSGYWVTVREAIGDLPSPTDNDDYEHDISRYPVAKMTAFRALMRSRIATPYNHIARKLGKGGLERLQALKPGQVCAELPDDLRPKSHFHYSYSRMMWSEPARTITKFAYHVGSGQYGHPELDRGITMREAARLQSFPDDFRFVGTKEIRKLSAMVGSAVPPLLARALGVEMAQYLDALYLSGLDSVRRAGISPLAGDAVVRRLEHETWRSDATTPTQISLLSTKAV